MTSVSANQPPRKVKRARMELRVAVSAKALIQRAMDVSGLTAGDLAYEGARRVLEDHDYMRLSEEDARVFLQAVAAPQPPPDRLIEAFKRRNTALG